MSRIRFVGGDIIETTGGNHRVYSKENIENSSDTQMIQVGKSGGVIYGEPQKAPDIKSQFFQDKIPEYVVLFKRLPSYKGEFGWDYMRDDYLTGTCIEGLEDLKKVYKPFEIQTKNATTSTSYGTYYTPWLSMFVNHNAVVGKNIELMIDSPVDFISDSVDFSKEEMTFVPSTPNLRVVPDKMPIADAINGGRIKIFCDATLDADATIDIKSSKGDIVGKMNVLKNKDVDKLTINVYVIKSYIVKDDGITDDPFFGQSVIDAKINAKGGLQSFEDYLNKQSLNQGLIQVKFKYDSNGKPYDWPFRKSSLENASNEDKYKGMLKDNAKMVVDTGKYMDYINDRFKMKFSNLVKKKGIFLYLTSLDSVDAGGASQNSPLDNKNCIIYMQNLEILSSYAHEIGHTLGLEHTFQDNSQTNNQKKTNAQSKLAEYRSKQNVEKTNKNTHLTNNQSYYNTHPVEKASAVTALNKNIDVYNDTIKYYEDEIKVIDKNPYKFGKKTTENILDYNLNNRVSFFKWQWEIMKDESKIYYHE